MSQLYHFVDLYLQKIVGQLLYLCISSTGDYKVEKGLGFLTLDFTSVYSNIEHCFGLREVNTHTLHKVNLNMEHINLLMMHLD